MKRDKIATINSYASYKQNKKKMLMTLLILFIGMIILLISYSTGHFQSDVKIFLNTNGISLFEMQEKVPSDNVILSDGKICYELYTVPMQSKGIYIPASRVNNIDDYIKLAKETQVNTFVIDVKNDYGYLTFATDNKMLCEAGIVKEKPPIEDIDRVIKRLNEANIYPIARIVAFKDNVYTMTHPESALKGMDGTSYVTSGGDYWLDPYNRENWDYILEVCEEASSHGFKEIQFDYVRFHESMNENTVMLQNDETKTEIITEFIAYISGALHERHMRVSADVFGAVILSDLDASIVGQDFVAMSGYLDYISPMVYPSHYAEGTFGIAYPHLEAYQMILKTMNLGNKKLAESDKQVAKIRPWLQDFTLSKEPYLLYGPDEIKDQIKGANDAQVMDWLFWNAAGNYTKEGLKAQ